MKAIGWNQKTIAEFQSRNGRGIGPWGDNLLLMTAKGATSGEEITTPLVYRRQGDDYVVVASKGGAPEHPKWYGNLKANPVVEVEVAEGSGTKRFEARARPVPSGADLVGFERSEGVGGMHVVDAHWPDWLASIVSTHPGGRELP